MNHLNETLDPRDLYGELIEKSYFMEQTVFEHASFHTTVPNTDAFESIGWLMLGYSGMFEMWFDRT